MSSFLFVNPTSGSYSASRLKSALEQLKGFGIVPEIFEAKNPAEIISRCEIINGYESPPLVIVAGGDGTINAVINGIKPNAATLALLPFGTSNVLAAEAGISSDYDAIERIAAGRVRSLSVGVIEFENRSLRFLLMAGIGLDGAVVMGVSPKTKRALHQGAYLLSAVKQAGLWDHTMLAISSENHQLICHTAIFCNASRYGGNFVFSPDSTPFYPGISAACFTDSRRRSYIKTAVQLFFGTIAGSSNLHRLSGSSFTIDGIRPIQVDGDFVGYSPARVSLHADFANMLC